MVTGKHDGDLTFQNINIADKFCKQDISLYEIKKKNTEHKCHNNAYYVYKCIYFYTWIAELF